MKISVVPTNKKLGFPPNMPKMILEALAINRAGARNISSRILAYLRGITPSRSGFMRSAASVYGYKVHSWGFEFSVGWRRSNFGGGAFYPPYVTEGTGIYGLYGRRISPRIAPRLAWQYQGRWVSAKSIAGQKPKHLLERMERYGRKLIINSFQRCIVQTFKKFR